MSRRRGTVEERARRQRLFSGYVEKTRVVPIAVIRLYARRNGAGCYFVEIHPPWPGVRVLSKHRYRTLQDADEAIVNIIRDFAVLSAMKAFGLKPV